MGDYSYMHEGYENQEASHGFSDELLPSGWYPLEVENILEKSLSKKGSPSARIQLRVTEGKYENKRTFTNMTLGPAKYDKDGAERTKSDLQNLASTIQGQMRGFLQSLGATTGAPVGDADQAIYNFFNVDGWKGRQFMGFVKLIPAKGEWNAQNRLQGYRNLADDKKGIESWRAAQSNGAKETKATEI